MFEPVQLFLLSSLGEEDVKGLTGDLMKPGELITLFELINGVVTSLEDEEDV